MNVVFETRSPGARAEPLAATVENLLRLKVEVIVTGPNPFIDAAKQATASVPIVMVYGSDPIERGYISSWRGLEGNITGLTWEPSAEILGKHVELLSELSPRPSRVAGIVDPSSPLVSYSKEAEHAALGRGITLQNVQVGPDNDVSTASSTIIGGRAEPVNRLPKPSSLGAELRLLTSQGRIGCQPSTCFVTVLRRVGSCHMGQTLPTPGVGQPLTSTKS